MKFQRKNLLYELKCDEVLLEYKPTSVISSRLFKYLGYNHFLCIPIAYVRQYQFQKHWYGMTLHISLAKTSFKRDSGKIGFKKLRPLWCLGFSGYLKELSLLLDQHLIESTEQKDNTLSNHAYSAQYHRYMGKQHKVKDGNIRHQNDLRISVNS